MNLVLVAVLAMQAEPPLDLTPVTVLARGRSTAIERALVEGQRLWLPAASLPEAHGFTLKPEGLCAGELCIPLPSGDAEGWVRELDGESYVDVSGFARATGQVVLSEGSAWSFSSVPAQRSSTLGAGRAPDFTLPDREGREVRLSDFRGSKVLLLTWASW